MKVLSQSLEGYRQAGVKEEKGYRTSFLQHRFFIAIFERMCAVSDLSLFVLIGARYKPSRLCQAQIINIVPGTNHQHCTRYKSSTLYQVQNNNIVPGTNHQHCTRYKSSTLYQAQNNKIVPGTNHQHCTRYKTTTLYQVQK
jgi:S-ribosylhomocysteine lyase LuxS involved in autoinducer biosynthesis